jgi:hypothetical protein
MGTDVPSPLRQESDAAGIAGILRDGSAHYRKAALASKRARVSYVGGDGVCGWGKGRVLRKREP